MRSFPNRKGGNSRDSYSVPKQIVLRGVILWSRQFASLQISLLIYPLKRTAMTSFCFRCALRCWSTWILIGVLSLSSEVWAQRVTIPRRQDAPPGPPLTPAEALKKMQVPDGFSVELVAAEPQLINPVAMCIDDQGRFWVTESFEYPRREAGPGRDRIKVLQDTDRDGVVDKVTVFAEGLNIPSGIQVGYGGVWVANAPDLLFLQDTDGDLKADKTTRVLTGFGRTDTHELPNAFTWGPDGYLYGLNGVFNYCQVRYTQENPNYREGQPSRDFTCALWRLDPRTMKFEIFAEGTSNPWGIAINPQGDFFLSACVIDHLWHIAETGYYIRQGGPYPPHTWPMQSIVKHAHQKAAYCGIVYFDSEAYPEEFRDTLYMGNVHAGCLNADVIEQRGATYFGKPRSDFLTANDVWFMPVAQVVGPDGCLYVLDWYDRYHCYQDANADPEGVDRGHGRLYRISYKETPVAPAFDLASDSDAKLIERLSDPNVFWRNHAARLLGERSSPEIASELKRVIDHSDTDPKQRSHALWAYLSGDHHELTSLLRWTRDRSPTIAAWAVRGLGDLYPADPQVAKELTELSQRDKLDPRVALQVIVAVRKTSIASSLKSQVICNLLRLHSDDTITHIAWNALLPLAIEAPHAVFTELMVAKDSPAVQELMPKFLAVLADDPQRNFETIEEIVGGYLPILDRGAREDLVKRLFELTRSRAFTEIQQASLSTASNSLRDDESTSTLLLKAIWGSVPSQQKARDIFSDENRVADDRIGALQALIFVGDREFLSMISPILKKSIGDNAFRGQVIDALGGVNVPEVATTLLEQFTTLPDDIKPRVIELLTQRPNWTIQLLDRIAAKDFSPQVVNLNQLQRIATFKEPKVQVLVQEIYGSVRSDRRSDRQHVIQSVSQQLAKTKGDPNVGQETFKKVCGQCHKIHGEGFEVGPDITRNGRNDWNQLLQNVLDPSAVIGPGYQSRTVLASDGRVLTGLAVEESEQQVVLKVQGGKTETIRRDDIEQYKVNDVSMMPEDLEKQLSPQELADLFAFLSLDKAPSDPTAKRLPGAPNSR